VRPDHGGGGVAGQEPASSRCRDRCRHGRQHLSMRDLSADPRCDQGGRDMSRLRKNVNRRSVLKAGALVVAFSLAGAKVVSARVLVRDGADEDAPPAKAIGGFVRIEAAGRIVLVMPSVEMGQGMYTAEAVLLAE